MYQEIEMSLKTSNKIFVIDGDTNYTYRDLLRMIKCIHTILRKNNFARVLIHGKQSFFSYASLIGTYLVGGTFCVLNEDIPESRKQYIVDCFKPDIFMCEKKYMWDFEIPSYSFEEIYSLTNYDKKISNIYNNDILYVSFTSGTTGYPKGCKISRKAFEKFCDEAFSQDEIVSIVSLVKKLNKITESCFNSTSSTEFYFRISLAIDENRFSYAINRVSEYLKYRKE